MFYPLLARSTALVNVMNDAIDLRLPCIGHH
jgi:hypothetical protein